MSNLAKQVDKLIEKICCDHRSEVMGGAYVAWAIAIVALALVEATKIWTGRYPDAR